ncbi:NEDD8 activating enzyme [Colletotrichum sp. SAR11_240]|nr:NEDD8 activating enzyme [Colletotrichum sp. SAR11_240]
MSAPRKEYKNTNPTPGTPFFEKTAKDIATQNNIHTLNEALDFGEHSNSDQERFIAVALDRALKNTSERDPLYAAIEVMNTPDGLRAEAARVSGHPEEWPFFAQTLRNAKADAAQAQTQAQ